MDFTLIARLAREAEQHLSDVIEVTQHGHYNQKMQLWAICRNRGRIVWTTWLYR